MDTEKYTDRVKGFLQSAQGYALRLAENTPGHVRFELAKAVTMP